MRFGNGWKLIDVEGCLAAGIILTGQDRCWVFLSQSRVPLASHSCLTRIPLVFRSRGKPIIERFGWQHFFFDNAYRSATGFASGAGKCQLLSSSLVARVAVFDSAGSLANTFCREIRNFLPRKKVKSCQGKISSIWPGQYVTKLGGILTLPWFFQDIDVIRGGGVGRLITRVADCKHP